MIKDCKKCKHYYVRMVDENGKGFNPSTSCYVYEDTNGKIRSNVWTKECFNKKVKS